MVTLDELPYGTANNDALFITVRARVTDTAVDTYGNGYVISNSALADHDLTPVIQTNVVTNVLYEPPLSGTLVANPNPLIVGDTTNLTVTLTSGVAASIDWDYGDGSGTGLITNPSAGDFTQNNQYVVPGLYTVTVVLTNGHYSSPLTLTQVIMVEPNLLISKVAEPASGQSVLVGDSITYTVVVTNGAFGGADPLTGIVMTDTLPAGVGYVSGAARFLNSGTSVPVSENSGVVTVGPLTLHNIQDAPGINAVEVTIVVTVTGNVGDVLTNTAEGRYSGYMPYFGPVTTTHTIVEEQIGDIFLPIITKGFVPGPDLVVESATANSSGVQVVIKNIGNAPVQMRGTLPGFYVDFYAGGGPPSGVNDVWNDGVSPQGVAWRVTGTDAQIAAGDVFTLEYDVATNSGAYVVFNDGQGNVTTNFDGTVLTNMHAQVDSASNAYPATGAVYETHEIAGGAYNNISSASVGSFSLQTSDEVLTADTAGPDDRP
ncbi:MAG: hypothetical protein Kow0031_07700 [Anaerolineae bacterium]